MTNRDDSAHGLMRSKSNVLVLNERVMESVYNKTKKLGAKAKPSLELYQPPPKNNSRNGARVHFQSPPRKPSPTPPNNTYELKSALKRSKSFTSSNGTVPMGSDTDMFPLEYHGLIRSAMLDPNILSTQQLMELVRLICCKAVENAQNAQPAAKMCFAIIEKEKATTFLECLLNSCHEWYNERDKLLRTPFPTSHSAMSGHAFGGSRRWTAYVSFLTELYLYLKRQRKMVFNHTGSADNSVATHHAFGLLSLLYECSCIILKPPAVNNVTEIECLRSMLFTVGRLLEKDAPLRMQQVVVALRDAFVNPSVTAQIRKTILELIELHASNWQLDVNQSVYYFPYTSAIS